MPVEAGSAIAAPVARLDVMDRIPVPEHPITVRRRLTFLDGLVDSPARESVPGPAGARETAVKAMIDRVL